jgi:glycosyltransferase involved in cell wall biosynthesis
VKVAMIGLKGVPALHGGIERHVEELGRELVRLGHDVTVYCRRRYTPPDAAVEGLTLRRLPSVNTKHLDAWTHTLLASVDAAPRRFDVYHYHALGPATLAFIPRLLGKTVVVTVHGLDWQREKWGPVASAYLRLGEWAAARLASRTIVVSRELQRYFARRYRRRTTYIPNAVAIPGAADMDALRPYGIEPGGYVLAVGRLVPEKGTHHLVEAYRQLETDLPLVVVGDDPHGKYLDRLKELADERVRFVGYVYGPPLAAFFAGSRLYVQPSTLEGLSIALLEAMSHGAPILASDIPPNVEALADAGFYFPAGDVGALAGRLRELLAAPGDLDEKGAAARRRVAGLYSWEEVARRTVAVYEAARGR